MADSSNITVGTTVIATKRCNGSVLGASYVVRANGSGSLYIDGGCTCKETWQKKGGPMESLKQYFKKHQETFITLAIVILVDEFMFGGALKSKVKSLLDRILSSAEKKLIKEEK